MQTVSGRFGRGPKVQRRTAPSGWRPYSNMATIPVGSQGLPGGRHGSPNVLRRSLRRLSYMHAALRLRASVSCFVPARGTHAKEGCTVSARTARLLERRPRAGSIALGWAPRWRGTAPSAACASNSVQGSNTWRARVAVAAAVRPHSRPQGRQGQHAAAPRFSWG